VDIRKLFKLQREPDREELTRIRRGIDGYTGLRGSLGWDVLRGDLIEEANVCMEQLVTGTLDQRLSDRLASRVETIGWVLDLPDRKLGEYADLVKLFGDNPQEEDFDE